MCLTMKAIALSQQSTHCSSELLNCVIGVMGLSLPRCMGVAGLPAALWAAAPAAA